MVPVKEGKRWKGLKVPKSNPTFPHPAGVSPEASSTPIHASSDIYDLSGRRTSAQRFCNKAEMFIHTLPYHTYGSPWAFTISLSTYQYVDGGI